jgi:hypothetical protein
LPIAIGLAVPNDRPLRPDLGLRDIEGVVRSRSPQAAGPLPALARRTLPGQGQVSTSSREPSGGVA